MKLFLRLSQNPQSGGKKIQQCIQKPEESVLNYCNQLETIFAKNPGLSAIDQTTYTFLNYIFVDGLVEELSLLIKRTNLNWRTMQTPVLVNLPIH